jgi:acetyltransferase-like isoleucine patch superfamily enzyme
MKIGIIDTVFYDKKIDYGLYKIGEYCIVERIIKCLKLINVDKLYILINSENYSSYKHFIESGLLNCVFCDSSQSLEWNIKGLYSSEDYIFVVDSNAFIDDYKTVISFVNCFWKSERILGVICDNKKEACLSICKGRMVEKKLPSFLLESDSINKIVDLDNYVFINKLYNQKICFNHMKNGVNIMDVDSTYIGENVLIGKGVVIYPNNYIYGNTKIDDNCIVFPNCFIDCSYIKKDCEIGPYAHLKKNCIIGEKSIVGAFVEIKNSVLKRNVKAKHHAYIGDADIGDLCNIGCGVIFANYDGKKKNRSKIGKKTFIGSNVTIISPVTVGNKSLLAAGSTIVNDVDDNTLAIARERQINKGDYYKE